MEEVLQSAAVRAREWRRILHSKPELAFEEKETAAFLSRLLREMGLRVETGIGGSGVVAVLGEKGPLLGLRCELDALPLEEKNVFEYRSLVPGRMHACGHDGHMAMLAGAADVLCSLFRERPSIGRICFIFQPAEENEGGARRMIEEGFFDRYPLDAIFAMHNWPGLEAGSFGLRTGAIMAAFDRFEIHVRGTGSHAAMPQEGNDVILAQAGIVLGLHAMQSRKNPMEPAVLSVTAVHGGEAFNILPEEVHLRGTLRTFHPDARAKMIERTRHILAGMETAYGVRTEFSLQEGYPPTVNTEAETLLAREAAILTAGANRVVFPVIPDTGSEDFACFLEKVPGSYVWIGNGTGTGRLHNPRYDFNDEILATGISFWVNLSRIFFERRAA